MTITPDTKDWTWVLSQACTDCGFDARSIDSHRVGDLLRANTTQWTALLASADGGLARRPQPGVWSALEYSCHVRDVFRKFDDRLRLLLAEDDPLFDNWDQDATAIEGDYAAQDPTTVGAELAESGQTLAAAFDAVPVESWERSGRRSDGARFTVDTLARYLAHDPIHHWHDVTGERYPARA